MTMPAAPPAPATGDPAPQPPAPAPAPAPTPPAPPSATDDGTDWKAEAEKWKKLSRQNEDRAKGNVDELTRQGTALAAIAEKLGLDLDGKPDPATLQAALDKAQAAEKQKTTELAVYRTAAAAGADADALLDSRSFMATVEGLDPSSATYLADVTEAAKAWAAANPKYAAPPATPPAPQPPKAKPPVPKSGGDFGAPAPNRQWTKADVDAATPEELTKAMNDGLLKEYGFGAPRNRRR